jgi:hypothetical protein
MSKQNLTWKRIGRTKRAQYQVSHLAEVGSIKKAFLSGETDGTLDMGLDVIANEDTLIVAYYKWGKKADEDYFFEFVLPCSSIEEAKNWADQIFYNTEFNTSIRYLVSAFGMELQS